MDEQILKSADLSVQGHSWCIEWFGSQGDFKWSAKNSTVIPHA